MLHTYIAYPSIKKVPTNLFTLLLLTKIPINCNITVIVIKITKLLLNSALKDNGLIDAPNPINKNKFIIFEPVIFPNNKSVSHLLADIMPVTISGSAVPKATIVAPIKLSDQPKLLAIIMLFSTTTFIIIFLPIVIAIYLYVSRLMMEKKRFWLYAIAVILMSTIHYSALFLLPLYLLYNIDLERFFVNLKIQFILFFSSLILSTLSLWQSLLGTLDKILALIGYERYSSDLLLEIGSREMNFGPRRIIFLIIDFIIISYSHKLRAAFRSKTFGFALILFIIYFTFMPLFMDNMAFSRIIDYFQIGRVLMCSYLLFYLFKYKRTEGNYIIAILLVALLFLHLFIQIYADNGLDCIRYQFCFGKKSPIIL